MSHVTSNVQGAASTSEAFSNEFSKNIKEGIKLPVGVIHKHLKNDNYARKVSFDGSRFMTGVLEYLSSEILGQAIVAATDDKTFTISEHHLQLVLQNNEKLKRVFEQVLIKELEETTE